MRHSLSELLAVVYRFYPRGLRQYDPGYKATEEYRRLVQARIHAGADGNPWDVFLDRLSVRFPDEPKGTIQNGSVHLPTGRMDAGYIGCFWLPPRGPWEKNHMIGFLVSFLVPCYVVYSSAHISVSAKDPEAWSHQIHFTFSPDEAPCAQVITEEIVSAFPDYELMPPEIGNVVVTDVEPNSPMGKATLYHCLFTDAW